MIIERGFEGLKELGTARVGIDDLINRAEEMEHRWTDEFAVGNQVMPVMLTKDQRVSFAREDGSMVESDLTENAFSQLCQRAGLPAAYVRRCFDSHREDLAVENYKSWAEAPTTRPVTVRVRMFDDVMRAALTLQYNPFDHPEILYGVQKAVGKDGRYEANEAYLSPDTMHIRFVDFNHPLRVNNDKLFSGFTVSSSNVGTGAFSIKYFLYRFACRNGIVRIQHGGILFRQTHLKEFMENGETLFHSAIDKMHQIDHLTEKQIGIAMDRKLTAQELSFYLEKAQRELHFGQKGREATQDLIGTVYDPTLWGFVNAVTENAKNYTLDTRLEMEQWAGNILSAT